MTWRAYISDLSLGTTTTHRQRLRAFGRRLCRSYGEEWKMEEWKTDNDGPTQVDSLHPPNAIVQARQGHMARCNTHNGRINRNKERKYKLRTEARRRTMLTFCKRRTDGTKQTQKRGNERGTKGEREGETRNRDGGIQQTQQTQQTQHTGPELPGGPARHYSRQGQREPTARPT